MSRIRHFFKRKLSEVSGRSNLHKKKKKNLSQFLGKLSSTALVQSHF